MRKMPSMIIITFIRPRRMMWIQSVVKTKEKLVFVRSAGFYPAAFLNPQGIRFWGWILLFIRFLGVGLGVLGR